jgi:hypothetical protein
MRNLALRSGLNVVFQERILKKNVSSEFLKKQVKLRTCCFHRKKIDRKFKKYVNPLMRWNFLLTHVTQRLDERLHNIVRIKVKQSRYTPCRRLEGEEV